MSRHLPYVRYASAAVLAALGVLLPGVARADEPSPPTGRFFEQHDKNADGKVAADEFTGDKEVFQLLDKNGDGAVTPEEVGLPADFRPQPKPPRAPGAPDSPDAPRVDGGDYLRRVKEMDKNGDGKVSREEFTGAPERFDRADRNKDGFLDASDFEGAMREGAGRMRERMRERRKQLDKDGDGRVSREEYSGELPFDQLDKNQDGYLDDADMPKGPDGKDGRAPGRKEPKEPGAMEPGTMEPGNGPGAGKGRGQGGRKPALSAEALRRFDSNADGKVTKDEFPGNEQRFAQLDKNGDGALTPDDLEQPGSGPRPGEGPGAKPEEDGMPTPPSVPETPRRPKEPKGPKEAKEPKQGRGEGLRGMDRDGNEKVSREEFQGSDEDWRRLDKNQDGWIAGDEIPPRPRETLRIVVEELIRRDDKNGDGRIAKDEFTGPADRFLALDMNHDGHVDLTDL
jgi:Ca2+-binding EF-hand superfamily protein